MLARDVMSRPVVSVTIGATVRDAVTILTGHGFATVPVVDDRGRVVGIVSESDGLRADDRTTDPVGTVMTAPVEVTVPDADVSTIAARMLGRRLRALPVVEEGRLVGIVARRDLLRTLVLTDDMVKADVRRLLDQYAGRGQNWDVAVTNGRVTVTGDFTDEAERSVVGVLTQTIGGVTGVDVVTTAPEP